LTVSSSGKVLHPVHSRYHFSGPGGGALPGVVMVSIIVFLMVFGRDYVDF
jgi:hypothetical protein